MTKIFDLKLTLILAFLLGNQSPAQEPEDQQGIEPTKLPASTLEQERPGMDPAHVESFLDGAVGAIQQVHAIPGITVSVVHDGKRLFSKGYGFLDAARTRPVDPETSLFRIGSTSKTFTWTAVMQLVEKGDLDLDADVNIYLTALKIPDTYPDPVTLRHILTHTAGFEDGALGYLFYKSADDLNGMESWLTNYMPARVRAPGTFSSYSNYATALAGYIVGEVSGLGFDGYVEANIFEPLEMSHSTFREPVPDAMAAGQSDDLKRDQGDFSDTYFEYIHDAAPAGSMSSTANDMAKWMLAHLGDGAVGGNRILSETTTLKMRSQLFTHHEGIPAMLHGFMELPVNGRFGYGHGGDTVVFHTDMTLVPSEGLGIFISSNAADGGIGVRQIVPAFFDEFLPAEDYPHPSPIDPEADDEVDVSGYAKYAGSYRGNRRSYTTWEKILALAGDLEISVSPAGGIVLPTFTGKTQRMVPAGAEGVFQSVDDPDTVVGFREDADGNVTHAFLFPIVAHERVGALESGKTHQVLLGIALVVFVWVIFGTIKRAKSTLVLPKGERSARLAIFFASLLNVVFVVVLVSILASGINDLIFSGLPGATVVLSIPVFAALFGVWSLVQLPSVWVGNFWTFWARLRYSIIVLLLVIFAVILNYWNVFGPWYAS